MKFPLLIITTTPHGVHSHITDFGSAEAAREAIYYVVSASDQFAESRGYATTVIKLFSFSRTATDELADAAKELLSQFNDDPQTYVVQVGELRRALKAYKASDG